MSTFLISGASGFVGRHLARALKADGHRVARLARPKSGSAPQVEHTVSWDPRAGTIDDAALAQLRPDVVVNLAGEPIGQRWTSERRQRIRDSRVQGTSVLAAALARLSPRPSVLVSGSAMGYYGAHRGDELLDETSDAGADFLAQTARAWEQAAAPAADAGIRVVYSRTGLVLGRDGGVLERMLPPFQFAVGGRLGDGQQWMSWITIDDTVRVLRFCADTPAVNGAVNVATPNPVRNEEFTAVLAKVLYRPAFIPVPRLALELIFGTMAENTLLASQRLVPRRLQDAGFEFLHPRLEEALRAILSRSIVPADR